MLDIFRDTCQSSGSETVIRFIFFMQVIGSLWQEDRQMTAVCLEEATLLCLDCECITDVVNNEDNTERVTKKVTAEWD